MRDKLVLLSECLIAAGQDHFPVSLHEGRLYRNRQFAKAVGACLHALQSESEQRYALYTQDAYPFAVLLFSLLHAGKEVWIPGNNLPDTARKLQQEGCKLLGDWPGLETSHADALNSEKPDVHFAVLDENVPRIVLYTSGSSGQPKSVPKTLRQLQAEIETLEKLWGDSLGDAAIAGTVSHQHIYGLLFRVLWPLSARRCFHSRMFLSPEALFADSNASRTCWIASPAHLKRLDEQSPWQGIASLALIFSSGGPLPTDSARRIFSAGGRSVIEVYGSTETGGIAWRQAPGPGDNPWQLFENIRIKWLGDAPHLYSPYLLDQAGLPLEDRLTQLDDGRLLLHGRQDRIVKIEEKRLSLTALERHLQDTRWISEAHALELARQRDVIAVVAVLSENGSSLLSEHGRRALIKQLRGSLADSFDAVTLPRQWLFVNSIPLTPQGKVNQDFLTLLVNTDISSLPKVQAIDLSATKARMQIRISKELRHFSDHFPGFPLLPGVVQIGWAEHFGKIFFPVALPFSHMEAIKFGHMIRPNEELELCLEWREAAGKLSFRYSAGSVVYSSGRMVYGAGE